MATMLSITIDSKIAASVVDRRGERTELAAMLEQIVRELQCTLATSNATLRHRDGSTAAGSWTYTPVLSQ
jgi:hypothetical protein